MTPLATPAIPKKGRNTNQLQFLLKNVVRTLWRHHYAWPFLKPVDPVALRIPVSYDLTCVHCMLTYLVMSHDVWSLCYVIAGLFYHHQEAHGHVHDKEKT